MEEQVAEKFLLEIRDRVGDAMAAIQLLSPLVEEKGSERDRAYLAAMNKSFYRLLRLLRHAEICKATSIPEDGTVDLAGLCRKLGRDAADMARILGTSFELSLADSSVVSRGDADLLEMAVLNLLVNAFEAAGPGGEVTLKGTLENGNWVMAVTDNGCGLRRAEEDPDPLRKTPGGVGLGLAAVQRVAELHGGVLMKVDKGAWGEVERGFKAVLSLPVRKPEGGAVKAASGLWGGFFPVLVEFSPLLPAENFQVEDTK